MSPPLVAPCPGWRALLFALLLLVAGAPSQVRADAVDDLAQILDIAGYFPGIPVTGQDVRDSKAIFVCIDKAGKSDVAIALCIDASLDTPIGQQAATQSGLPSWFGKLVEIYIDVRTKDWWALVEDAGMAVACAAAQVITTQDVCGIAQAIIEMVGAAKEAFDDVIAFLEDVGCAVGVGCGPDTPREVVAYGLVFEPRIPDGLAARKATSANEFPKLLAQLEQNALAKPAKLSVPGYPVPETFTKAQVAKAAKAWTSAVDKRWTDDLVKSVLPARAKAQAGYATAQRIAALAAAAENAYAANPKTTDPAKFIVDTCAVADFGQAYGYAHVDVWILHYPDQAKKLPGLKSNRDWCAADFFGANVALFAQHFRGHLQATNTCVAMGQGLVCQTLAKYEACVGLMSGVGQQGQCGVNTASVGKQLADQINQHFADVLHSKFSPCRVDLPDDGAPLSAKPVGFVCKRPTQQHFCKQRLEVLWNHPVPAPLVCAPAEPDPAYAALAAHVKQAAAVLRAKYPSVGLDAIDPLIVHAGKPDVYATLAKADASVPTPGSRDAVNFRYQPAMVLTIDGTGRPTIVGDLEVEPVMGVVQPDKALVAQDAKPADPDPVLSIPDVPSLAAPAPATAARQPSALPAQPRERAVFAAPSFAPPQTAPPAPTARMLGGTPPAPTRSAATEVQARPPAAAAVARVAAASAGSAPVATTTAAIQRELAAASCRVTGGERKFTCTTRAGFDRCEAMRQQRRVDHCALGR